MMIFIKINTAHIETTQNIRIPTMELKKGRTSVHPD